MRNGAPEPTSLRTSFIGSGRKIALEEIDRLIETGVRFGDVLADAGYGTCAEFRNGLSERQLLWTVGIVSNQGLYSTDVRSRVHPPTTGPEAEQRTRGKLQREDDLRRGSASPRSARICVSQGHVATRHEGTSARRIRRDSCARGRRSSRQRRRALAGRRSSRLIAERRTDEIRYYLSNRACSTSLKALLAASVKARWSCHEQAHQQLKEELGLDHFEGRSWHGLHHHAVLTMVAFAFLQHLRLRENKA